MRFVFKKELIHGHNSIFLMHIKLNILICEYEIIDTDQLKSPLLCFSTRERERERERIYLLLIFLDYLSMLLHASGHKSNGINHYYNNKSRNLNYNYHYHYHFKYHNNRIGIHGKTHDK
jgi:hypothetical protein